MKPDMLARAKDLYEGDLTMSEVGKVIGRTGAAVSIAFKKAGISRPRRRKMTDKTAQIIAWYESGLSSYEVSEKIGVTSSSIRHTLMTHGKIRPAVGRYIELEVAVWASRFVHSCQRMPGNAPFDLRLNSERVDVKSAHASGDGTYKFSLCHKGSEKNPHVSIDSYFLVFLDRPGRPLYRLPVDSITVKRTLSIKSDLNTAYPLQLLGHLDASQKGV